MPRTQKSLAAPKRAAPRRNRQATEAALLKAAKDILTRDGFQALGVNEIARHAGVDKVLIYRYFGGLEGLSERLGEAIAATIISWLEENQPETALGGTGKASYASVVEAALLSYWRGLRADPAYCQFLLWELADSSGLGLRLAEGRSKSLRGWVAKRLGATKAPGEKDAPAINSLLIAAIHQLGIAMLHHDSFAGLGASSTKAGPQVPARLEAALRDIIRSAYA